MLNHAHKIHQASIIELCVDTKKSFTTMKESINLNHIQSPWRWRQHIPTKCWKKCTKLLNTIICEIPAIQAWKLHYNKHITILYTMNVFSTRPAGKRMGRKTASKHTIKKIANDFVQSPHNMCSSNTNFITNIYFYIYIYIYKNTCILI